MQLGCRDFKPEISLNHFEKFRSKAFPLRNRLVSFKLWRRWRPSAASGHLKKRRRGWRRSDCELVNHRCWFFHFSTFMIISVRNARKCHKIRAVISLQIVRTRFKVHWYPLKLEFFPFCTQLHTTWESPVAMPSRQMFSLLRGARGSVFLLALRVCRLSKGAPLPAYNPPLPPQYAPHNHTTKPLRWNIKEASGRDGDRVWK